MEQGGVPRAALLAAASIGLTAWRAGQDIKQALEGAGYTYSTIQGVYEYITSGQAEADEKETILGRMSTKKRGSTTSSTTSTSKRRQTIPVAPNVKQYVKTCMERLIEKKFLNQAITITNITGAGTIQQAALFNITQGTGDSNRTGNIIKVSELWWHLTFTDTQMNVIRAVLLWDRQPNGAAAAIADVFNTSDINASFNTNTVIGHGGRRFKIVSDNQYSLIPPIVATNHPVKYNKRINFKSDVPVVFGGNAGTIADMTTNNLFWVFFSNTNTCDLSGNLQVKFTDN